MAQYGIKASQISSSSGPKGLLKSDVVKYIQENNLKPIQVEEAAPARGEQKERPAKKPAKAPTTGYTDHPLSSMRSVIAQRLTQSKQTSPHGYVTAAANIDAVLRLRKDFERRGVKVSVNDFVIKAVATALQHVPEMNLNVNGEDFKMMPNIDVSVAVATDKGLITPIVKDVPSKSIGQISLEVKDLAKRAREGKLQLNEFQGGTFTISNLGMFGISEFTAIINPPQVGILAVGSGLPQINPETGHTINVMKSTLSFDRRFIDEAMAADFMSTFQTIMERPEFLNLGLEPIVRRNRQESQAQ
jgi:pyruvate dehydrogenase complex dihydrolipoamide acetyltransferase long form